MRIDFYHTNDGKVPAREYIDSLDGKQAQKVTQTLESIRDYEGRVPSTMLKKLKGTNIWEVRVIFAGNIFRLLSFFDAGNLIIVAHGFTKKTQKTPKREIDTAERRRRNYFA
jgi:phage-related protein